MVSRQFSSNLHLCCCKYEEHRNAGTNGFKNACTLFCSKRHIGSSRATSAARFHVLLLLRLPCYQTFTAMSTDDRIRKKRSFRNPMLLMGLAMTIFYLVLGVWLLADPNALPGIPSEFRNIFAAMVLIYGGYRGWRVWADHF